MSTQPAVLSATELDNPVIGNTIQVSVVCKDLYEGLAQMVALGIGPFQVFEVGPHNAHDLTYEGRPADFSMKLAFATHENMMWEVVQPISGPTIYQDFLDAGGFGIHHVAIDGRGLPYAERAKALEARGFRYVQGGVAFNGDVPFGYFHNGNPSAPIVEIFDFPDGFAPVADEWYPGPPPEA